ncbi:MAG: hypothetical protein L0Z46_03605, partial [Nitrospiraceae bacterium]|nr:hypothetical protein [Nitrospiraceae bacterium]
LDGCDVILFEGVRSVRGKALTLSYSLMARRKRLGLVTQHEALRLEECRAELIHADVTTGEFVDGWFRIPWHWRVVISTVGPLYGAYRYLTASRASIARGLGSEDLESREEILQSDDMPEVEELILHTRDARLVKTIEGVLGGSRESQIVAVIYGAGHMRAVIRALMGKHRYRVVHSEWLTVFQHEV